MSKQCKRCDQVKALTEFSKHSGTQHAATCKPCVVDRNREYWRTPHGRLSYIFSSQHAASKARGHNPPTYSREALETWATQQGLDVLITAWAIAGYPKELAPSIDRLDDAKGYAFDNIQLVRWCDNNEKMYVNRKAGVRITAQNRRIEQRDVDGTHVAYFPSIALAARTSGVTRTNINAMCAGNRPHVKTVGGFLWSYA